MAEEKKIDLFGTSSASSGGSAPATNYTPKPNTSSGNSDSNTKYSGKVNYSKAASNARIAVNNAKGKAGGAYATRRNYTSFGSGIDNSGRPLTGQFSQQGTSGAARVYAGGGLNPSAWGSSFTSPSVTRDSELQKAINDLTLSTDYADRNIHAIDPLEGEDEEHAAAREAWNMGRQMWAFNDTAGVFSREYANSEEQLADILDLMTHAQVYYKDALDNNYTFNIDGKEVSAADSWKDLYDRLDNYQGWLTDVGQVQDLFTRASMGESISTENIDTMKARAQARVDNPYGEDDAAMWAEIISGLDGLWNGANRADAQKLQAQLDELQTQLDQSATDMLAASQGETWINSPEFNGSQEDIDRIQARAADAQATRAKLMADRQAVQDQLDQLDAIYRERNMTPEIEEAMAALSLDPFKRDKYYMDKAREELTRLDEEGRVTNAAVSSRAHEMEQQDQALLDEWNTGLGFNPQFYNDWDRFRAALAGAFLQAGSGVVSAVNWTAKAGAEMGANETEYGSGRSVFEQPREPVVVNSVEEGTALAESLRTQIADLDAQKHALTHEGRAPVKGQKQFHSRTLAESRARTDNIAELDRQLRELHEQLGEVEFQVKQMSGEPTNAFEKLKYLSVEELAAGTDEVVDTLDSKSASLISQAKEGTGELGKLLIDVEVNGLQMLGDQAFGPASLAMLGTRVFGNKAAELRREGYDTWKQGAGAATDAAIEVVSECIFNVFGLYGGHGVTREFSERLVREWAETNVGRTLMRVTLATIGEQGEEWVAWHFAPLVDIALGEGDWAALNPVKPRSKADYEELANAVLVAGMLSMGMSSANVSGHKAANAALLAEDAAELGERSEQYERDIEDATSEMTPFTDAQQSNFDRVRALQSRIENTIKGRRALNEKGQVINPEAQRLEGAREVKKGKNRHDTATGVLAEGFEGEGYVNSTDADDDYNAATTGAEVRAPRTAAEALESEEAPEERVPDRTGEEELELEDERNQEELEDEEWEEQERIRALEEEGARRAAQAYQEEQDAQLRAAQEAEKYAQLAHNAREFEAEQEYLRKAQQARQAAEEAAKKAEEQLAMAASQSEALKGQEAPVAPAPANQDKVNQQLADSQTAALRGQEVNPQAAPAPQAPAQTTEDQAAMAQSQTTALEGQDSGTVVAAQSANPATGPETGTGAQATVTQANTQGETGEAVKPKGNAQGAVSTPVATAEQGRASIESGETNNKTVAQVIPMVDKYVSTGNVVSHVPENPFKSKGKQAALPLSKKVIQWMKNRFPTGVRANSLGGTPVVISERGIKNDVAHGVGEVKAATFAAVPDVIQNGVVVSRSDGSVKGVSVTIAGRVDLAGTPVNVYCVLKQADDGSKRFYLHEVSDGNGTVYYQLGNNKNATPALQDSSRTNPASADVASTTSIAQNPQAGNSTNSSTNVQTDGTIEAKGVTANDSQIDTGTATQDRERIKPGANSGVQEKGSGVRKTRASQVAGKARTKLDAELSQFNARGREAVSDSEYTDSMRELEDLGDCAVSFAVGGNEDYGYDGFADSSEDSFGVVVSQAENSNVEAGETAVHEITHFRLHKFTPRVRDYMPVPNRLKHIVKNVMPSSYYSRTRALIAQGWADLYLTDDLTPSEIKAVQSMNVPNDILRFLGNKLSEPVYREYMNMINEEMTCELNAGRYSWFASANFGELTSCEEATKLVRTALMNDGVFEQGALDNVGDLISRVNKDIRALVDKKAEAAFEQAKKNAEPASKFDPDKRFGLYSVPYNGKRDLIAVRNTSVSSAIRAILDGGMAMPSIAITKASRGHSSFGEISIIFRSDTIDPSKNEANNVYSVDAYTPLHPTIKTKFFENSDAAQKDLQALTDKIWPNISRITRNLVELVGYGVTVGPWGNSYLSDFKAAFASDTGYDLEGVVNEVKKKATNTESQKLNDRLNKVLGFDGSVNFAVLKDSDAQTYIIMDADTGELYLDSFWFLPNANTFSSASFDEDIQEHDDKILDNLTNVYESKSQLLTALNHAAEAHGIKEAVIDAERYIKAQKNFLQDVNAKAISLDAKNEDYITGDLTETYRIVLDNGQSFYLVWKDDYTDFTVSGRNKELAQDWLKNAINNIEEETGEYTSRAKSLFHDRLLEATEKPPLSAINTIIDSFVSDQEVAPWAINYIKKFGETKSGYDNDGYLVDATPGNALNIMRKQPRRHNAENLDDDADITVGFLHRLVSHWFGSFDEMKSREYILSNDRSHNTTAYSDAEESLNLLLETIEDGYEGGDPYYNTPNADKLLYDLAFRFESKKGLRSLNDQALRDYIVDELYQSGWTQSGDITANDIAGDIIDVFDEIADLPTGYFEAKPDRIVSKDEYAILLIPKDSDNSHYGTADNDKIQELKRLCDENAIPYIEYSNDRTRTQIIQQDLGEYLFSKKAPGRTPGRVKQSQSAFEQDVATKGERANTDAAIGEAEFLSRTNEARSRTADALTDTQEKADAQVQRLLKEDYVWNDDDVVIAQKVMFDMVKAIRDYQLKKTSKLSVDAFRKMTEQYNQLMTKHQQKLSAAGQELQANYMFSTGDKIVMKAAQTFLGFTKDGRFAGGAVNAKNAKIYAGIEEASRRIQAAVDRGDTQGLIKICKDISDIRNVKKMFGPLSQFASEMESRVLNRIAKGENAAQNLENLAYGNLNAVCDDVQPYKALNAAKTIRIMNMLSNSATIVNNLANNFMQGTVSRSTVGQAFTRMAATPFENLTGQQVISKAKTGVGARKAIHNAKVEAFETSVLMQMYGIKEANGRLELDDRGMFNPNINLFEQTMSLYRFLTGVGVESTDRMQGAGFLKSMELGIDEDIKAGKIAPHTREQRMQEARHEVNKLLYKDDNAITAWVLHTRDVLNKIHVGNERVGTIGLGDITMAFAKIPTNVIKFRLMMTPEGALFQVAQYAKGVNKAKRMHAEVLAKGIVEQNQEKINAWNDALQAAYEMEWSPARDAAIRKAQGELSKLNAKMWAEAQEACRGSVYKNLETIRNNYNENLMFDEAVERAGYMDATEMSQFEAAQLSRKIGWAAMSVGMMALGSILRALGALRDFDQEPDDALRKMNSDKGYKGLMLNLSAAFRKNHEWKDGDAVLDGEFLEVIAMPLTIGATAAEAAATAQDAKTWRWFKSMAGNGIAKTFEAVGDIPGMADAINMYESMTSAYTNDYDEKVSRLGAGLLQYAANTAPSFFVPNSVTQAVAGIDNKVRDPYAADTPWGQAKNIFMNKFPVLRNKVPVSVDVWGNERTYGEGLWGAVNKMLLPGDVLVYRKNKYEAEIERLVREGYSSATPKTTVNSSFEVGDEKYTMTAQEKLDFKAARNSQQKELFEAFMDSKYYEQLNDAERMKVFQALKTSAERDAKQDMLNDRQLNVEITRDKWETELLDVNDQIQFLAAKQMANNVLDRDAEDMDYAAVDEYLTGAYKALDEEQRELLDSTYSRLDDMFEAKNSYGISSEMFNTGYDIYKDYMSDEGRARVQGGYKDWEGSQMYTDISKATGANEKQMDFFEKKFVLYNNNAVVPEKYNTFVDAGWERETAQAMVKSVAGLAPTNGRKTVSYKQRLTAIATTAGLTEAQRWEAFYEYCPSSYTSVIKAMDRYKSNGLSYEKALKAAKKWDP